MYPMHESAAPLQAFVDAKQLERKGLPLSQLSCIPDTKEVVLVFDGNKVLDEITKLVHKNDPLATYTASTPIDAYNKCGEYTTLASTLPSYLPHFQTMFIFDGCGFLPRPEIDTAAPTPPSDLLNMFSNGRLIPAKNIPESIRKRVSTRFTIGEDVEGRVVRVIREAVRNTLRAPYLAWSQISALFAPSERRASEVYGCLELLAFPGIHRVITNIDTVKGTFDCVFQQEFFAAARAVKSDIANTDVARAVLLLSRNRQFHIRHLGNETLECLLSKFPFDDLMKKQMHPAHRSLMRRNIAALDAPVLTTQSGMEYLSRLYNLEKTSSVCKAFGTQAPAMFYLFTTTGPVMPKPFATFCQKVLADDWPLVDSTAYRKVAENILPLRVQVTFQLFQAVLQRNRPRYDVNPDIVWLRQYARFAGQTASLNDRRVSTIMRPPEIYLTYWMVSESDLAQCKVDEHPIFFSDIIPLADRSTPDMPVSTSMAPTLATILLRSLDLLGYFTHSTEGKETSGPSIYTQALERFTCPTLSEYGVLLIELIRTSTLNDLPIQTTLSHPDATMLPPGVRFAARLLSIIPMNAEKVWTGPFDVEMAAFGMNTRLLSSTLRHLTEVIATLMFYMEATTLPLDQLDVVISKLPFGIPTEFNAGFLMQWIFMNMRPDLTVQEVREAFPQLYSLENDLDALFWFWSMAYMAIDTIRVEEPDQVDEEVLYAAHVIVCEACRVLRPDCFKLYLAPMYQVQEPYYLNMAMPPHNGYGPQ